MKGELTRYRAVRAKGPGHPQLRAAIEDTVKREVIRVADAPMAFYLADLLNALDRGDSMPPPGEQHYPSRFQLTHDATGLTSGAAIVYIHRSKGRMIASAPREEGAESIARLLNHVDYPMVDDSSWLSPMARTGQIKSPPGDLPEPTVVPERSRPALLGLGGYLFALVLPVALLLGLLAAVAWPYAVAAVLCYLVFLIVVRALLRR